MDHSIELHDVVRAFGKVKALNGLSLFVRCGEILGLLGPNGSGKTTLIRIVAGLLRPEKGTVVVLGARLPNRKVAAHIGYMTQSAALYDDLSVRDNLVFFGRLYGLPRAEARARAEEIASLVALGEKLDAPVRHLSGGMKQRANLACALMHRPRLLLLDEPTVGVDPKLRRSLWDHFRRLNAEGATIVLSTHIMEEAERCHRVALIEGGRVLAVGAPRALRKAAGAEDMEEVFLSFSEGRIDPALLEEEE